MEVGAWMRINSSDEIKQLELSLVAVVSFFFFLRSGAIHCDLVQACQC